MSAPNPASLIFIVLRHVNSAQTNEYWQESYLAIRKYYPEYAIYIIDDHSNPEYITPIPATYTNITLIQSELEPGRGELLPYYYFHKYHNTIFNNARHAVCMHDSVFVNSGTIFSPESLPVTVKPLWSVPVHKWDNGPLETLFLQKLKNNAPLLALYQNKSAWPVCFGVMSVISYEFLDKVQNTYDIFVLAKYINDRTKRMALERIFAVCCQSLIPEYLTGLVTPTGIRQALSTTFKDYMSKSIAKQNSLSLIKVWTGR